MPVLSTTDELYPELAAAGGLPGAVTRALAELGSPLRARDHAMVDGVPLFAAVKHAGRSCQVYVAANERAFSCDFWHRGVQHGAGWTTSLAVVVQAVDGFCRGRIGVVELRAEHPWIGVYHAATLADAAALVDHRWAFYLTAGTDEPAPLGPLIAAAARRPRLRALLPFTSMYRLCFSRTTGYPYSSDCPLAWPIDGGLYRVVAPTGQTLGEGDAEAAADLLAAALPAGCGPAREGVADDPEPG